MQEPKTKCIEISHQDLPLYCPLPSMQLNWNGHPRVFLPIVQTSNQEIICPYCSTKYVLTNG